MSKKKTETTEPLDGTPHELAAAPRPTGMVNAAMPDFLREYTQEHGLVGTEGLARLVRPPALKIVQPQALEPYSSMFNVGDIVAVPINVLLAAVELDERQRPSGVSEPFNFIPVFHYAEYCCWNPIDLRGKAPAIRERSFDARSEVGRMCLNPDTWNSVPCPDMPEKTLRYSEHLNFVVRLSTAHADHPLYGASLVMSFFRGTHKAGSRLAALIKLRRAPIFACMFEARSKLRSDDPRGYRYYGWELENSDPPFIQSKDELDILAEAHDDMEKAYKDRALVVDFDVDEALDQAASRASGDDGEFA